MSIRLFLAEQYVPAFIKKRELKNLFQLTASAFARMVPSLDGTSFDDCLTEFALFTKTSVDRAKERDEDLSAIQGLLFQRAYEYGRLWRKRFGITTMEEVMRGGRILYRAMGIEFRGTTQGTIEIDKCFFSSYYTPATCEAISAIDAGIMAGLSDGQLMSFSQRITEGCSSCKAQMNMNERVA
jgi:hypothetical protein